MEVFDTSEYKVTYLLGAGASAKVLPTVKTTSSTESLSQSLRTFAEKLKVDLIVDSSYKDFITDLVFDLHWLADNAAKFGTPDTFAKFLYLQDRQSLPRLKNTLSFYFTVEQFINNKIDDRALIFLTTVIQRNNIFPTNIKILNWNYDFQIQLAAEVFKKEGFHPGFVSVHSPPLIGYYPPLGSEFIVNNEINVKDIAMVHLNGIAGFYFSEHGGHILNLFLNQKPKDINEIIEKIIVDSDKKHNLLTFAWENETDSAYYLRNRIEQAKALIAETDILVIIGYSFPFFNRTIDKKVFDSLKDCGKLIKIYYQDPYRTGEFLKKQFELSQDIEVIHISETDNYYVPHEL
jgi:hypothetical protein